MAPLWRSIFLGMYCHFAATKRAEHEDSSATAALTEPEVDTVDIAQAVERWMQGKGLHSEKMAFIGDDGTEHFFAVPSEEQDREKIREGYTKQCKQVLRAIEQLPENGEDKPSTWCQTAATPTELLETSVSLTSRFLDIIEQSVDGTTGRLAEGAERFVTKGVSSLKRKLDQKAKDKLSRNLRKSYSRGYINMRLLFAILRLKTLVKVEADKDLDELARSVLEGPVLGWSEANSENTVLNSIENELVEHIVEDVHSGLLAADSSSRHQSFMDACTALQQKDQELLREPLEESFFAAQDAFSFNKKKSRIDPLESYPAVEEFALIDMCELRADEEWCLSKVKQHVRWQGMSPADRCQEVLDVLKTRVTIGYDEAITTTKDALRTTILVENAPDIGKVIRALRENQHVSNMYIDNKWEEPGKDGYAGVHMDVQLCEEGGHLRSAEPAQCKGRQVRAGTVNRRVCRCPPTPKVNCIIAELQVHLSQYYRVKQEAHIIYESERKKDDVAKTPGASEASTAMFAWALDKLGYAIS